MTDIETLRTYARTQDPDAFRQLIDMYQGLVYSVCHRILLNEADTREAVQETFIKLASNAHKVRTSLAGWLHSCATFTATNLLKSRITRERREEAWSLEHAGESVNPHFLELSQHLDQALGELPSAERDLLVKYYFLDHSQADIARETGISQPAVKKRVDKAVEILRERLRRKGVVLATGVLAGCLTQASTSAATVPATLTASLTKIGVAGVGKNSTITIGGIIMSKTTVIIVSTGLLVAGIATSYFLTAQESGGISIKVEGPVTVSVSQQPIKEELFPKGLFSAGYYVGEYKRMGADLAAQINATPDGPERKHLQEQINNMPVELSDKTDQYFVTHPIFAGPDSLEQYTLGRLAGALELTDTEVQSLRPLVREITQIYFDRGYQKAGPQTRQQQIDFSREASLRISKDLPEGKRAEFQKLFSDFNFSF